MNLGKDDYVINRGDRIAQMVFWKYEKVELIEIDTLDDTKKRNWRIWAYWLLGYISNDIISNLIITDKHIKNKKNISFNKSPRR